MSAFILLRTNGSFPPGGFTFTDHITGKSYQGANRTFETLVQEVQRDRLANHRLWQDARFGEATHIATEVSEQICARLKNDKRYCSNGFPVVQQAVVPQAAPVVVTGKTCRYCGASGLTEVLCSTCSGRKVVGHKCNSCGKEQP